MHPRGAETAVIEGTASDKHQMMAILENALKLRSIEVGKKSYIFESAILTVSLSHNMGSIRLVDLAGSEKYETIKMTRGIASRDVQKSVCLKGLFSVIQYA